MAVAKEQIRQIISENNISSGTDDRDEAITGIYGVIGTVNKTPTFKFRVGVEGVFQELKYSDLFEEV